MIKFALITMITIKTFMATGKFQLEDYYLTLIYINYINKNDLLLN